MMPKHRHVHIVHADTGRNANLIGARPVAIESGIDPCAARRGRKQAHTPPAVGQGRVDGVRPGRIPDLRRNGAAVSDASK